MSTYDTSAPTRTNLGAYRSPRSVDEIAVALQVANRAADHQVVDERTALADELELAREVEVRIGERRIEAERALVRRDGLGGAAEVLEHDPEVEPVERDV